MRSVLAALTLVLFSACASASATAPRTSPPVPRASSASCLADAVCTVFKR